METVNFCPVAALAFCALFSIAFPLPAETTPLPAPKSERPGAAAGPTTVQVAAWFVDVSAIDSANQTFAADVVVRFRWQDPSLAGAGDMEKSLSKDSIWTLPWLVANGGSHTSRTLPETVALSPDGMAVIRQQVKGTFNQRLNLVRFPFDDATFSIRIVTPGLSPQEIGFVPDAETIKAGLATAVGMNPTLTMQDWQITGVRAFAEPYELMPGTSLAGYTIEFTAHRIRQHYVVKVLLPLALIVIMAMSVFWIDPSLSASQVSVSVTSMLTLIAYRFAIGNDVPKLPYLTLLDAFILVSTGIVFLALIEVVLTSKLASNGRIDEARSIDRMCRWLFPIGFLVATGSVLIFW